VPDSQVRLLVNDGNGHFELEVGGLPPGLSGWFNDLEARDFNGDGLPDLFFISVLPGEPWLDVFLLNQGGLEFTDASNLLPQISDFSVAIAAFDYEEDSDLDVVIANCSAAFGGDPYPSKLYANCLSRSEGHTGGPGFEVVMPTIVNEPPEATLRVTSASSMEIFVWSPSGRFISMSKFVIPYAGVFRLPIWTPGTRLPSGEYAVTFRSMEGQKNLRLVFLRMP